MKHGLPVACFVVACAPPPPVEASVRRTEVEAGTIAVARAEAGAPMPARTLAPLEESLDGVWELAEECGGAETTYTLTVHGVFAELVTQSKDGVKTESLELVDTRDRGSPAGVLVSPAGGEGAPLFRLYRDGAALVRRRLGASPDPVDLGSPRDAGAFSPRCTTFAAFIEHDELAKQGWTRTSFAGLTVAYPAKVFDTPSKNATKRTLAFTARKVFGSDMAGQRAFFSVQLALDSRAPGTVMTKHFSAYNFPDEDPEGPIVAGARGVEIQMGVEGVGTHLLAVRVRQGTTLFARVDWVSAFANQQIAMSDSMQHAIAARMMASIVYDTRP